MTISTAIDRLSAAREATKTAERLGLLDAALEDVKSARKAALKIVSDSHPTQGTFADLDVAPLPGRPTMPGTPDGVVQTPADTADDPTAVAPSEEIASREQIILHCLAQHGNTTTGLRNAEVIAITCLPDAAVNNTLAKLGRRHPNVVVVGRGRYRWTGAAVRVGTQTEDGPGAPDFEGEPEQLAERDLEQGDPAPATVQEAADPEDIAGDISTGTPFDDLQQREEAWRRQREAEVGAIPVSTDPPVGGRLGSTVDEDAERLAGRLAPTPIPQAAPPPGETLAERAARERSEALLRLRADMAQSRTGVPM
jgi:hypothetical protein